MILYIYSNSISFFLVILILFTILLWANILIGISNISLTKSMIEKKRVDSIININ